MLLGSVIPVLKMLLKIGVIKPSYKYTYKFHTSIMTGMTFTVIVILSGSQLDSALKIRYMIIKNKLGSIHLSR